MFRSLTFLAAAVSALNVHQDQDGDAMTPFVEAMIQAYRDCNDAFVASGYNDEDEWIDCEVAADDAFIINCGDDLACVDVVGAIPEVYSEVLDYVQTDEFWYAVLADE